MDDELKYIIKITGKKIQQMHELYIYIYISLLIPIIYYITKQKKPIEIYLGVTKKIIILMNKKN